LGGGGFCIGRRVAQLEGERVCTFTYTPSKGDSNPPLEEKKVSKQLWGKKENVTVPKKVTSSPSEKRKWGEK